LTFEVSCPVLELEAGLEAGLEVEEALVNIEPNPIFDRLRVVVGATVDVSTSDCTVGSVVGSTLFSIVFSVTEGVRRSSRLFRYAGTSESIFTLKVWFLLRL